MLMAAMTSLKDLALAAVLAGAAAVEEVVRGGPLDVRSKGARHDLVTEADRRSEKAIIDTIRAERPDDAILGEEFGRQEGTSGLLWLVDPVDGTTNFVHGRADYAVSVGVERAGEYVAGAIYRPVFDDWIAVEGEEVAAGNCSPGLSGQDDLAQALISFGFPHRPQIRPRVLALLCDLMPRIRDFRRIGSAACDLFSVATGGLDATVGFAQQPWDVAGGWAIVRALGGVYRRFETAGGIEVCVAGNPAVVEALEEYLRASRH
ncbi:Inositol-1-monophosphatase [Carbonactinospora thermoautotrophica]|uniref:inositol-phosphate phosphatase n=2 Tax=Carbonactinospora thermoautotrophica TaxID=1469144 RepID=A0A132MSD3_9ACTN|nr:Inositol-1-monophosphatase [Carbonactinospora thermoautotrophica]